MAATGTKVGAPCRTLIGRRAVTWARPAMAAVAAGGSRAPRRGHRAPPGRCGAGGFLVGRPPSSGRAAPWRSGLAPQVWAQRRRHEWVRIPRPISKPPPQCTPGMTLSQRPGLSGLHLSLSNGSSKSQPLARLWSLRAPNYAALQNRFHVKNARAVLKRCKACSEL